MKFKPKQPIILFMGIRSPRLGYLYNSGKSISHHNTPFHCQLSNPTTQKREKKEPSFEALKKNSLVTLSFLEKNKKNNSPRTDHYNT